MDPQCDYWEETMAVNFNFFNWVRDGVKQSVLMGVSDAVQHLGTPREGDDVQQRLTTFLQDQSTATVAPRLTDNSPRRKLGRTLQDIHATTVKPSQPEVSGPAK
jgi:hypothetical protein